MVSCLFSILPVLAYLLLLPRKWHGGRWDRRLSILFFFLFTAGHLFEEVAELLFWDEFTSRFNFVAVDYLVYTNEVIGNISQSYPVALFLGGITVAAGVITLLARRWLSTVRTVPAASHAFCRRGAARLVRVFAQYGQLHGYIRRYRRSVSHRAVQGWAVQPVPRVFFQRTFLQRFLSDAP